MASEKLILFLIAVCAFHSMGWAKKYIGAIDQGTSSTRFMIFNERGEVVSVDQMEHSQIFPHPGWVEHNPKEIWANTQKVIRGALRKAKLRPSQLVGVGITNQRETTVVWNKLTGEPYYNAIVWNDIRTANICDQLERGSKLGIDRFRAKTGLPIAPYFSGSKLKWILDNCPEVEEAACRGEALFGTIDSWLVWNLSGGKHHITDPTNACRTMLMNIDTLQWDENQLVSFGVPKSMLPTIMPSSEVYCTCDDKGVLPGVPVCGILGDQQAALFGQACIQPGMAKATYGTGAFILMNTGTTKVPSTSGLITTVAYQLGNNPPAYALEGSVAYCGSLIQWLRDNLEIIKSAADTEEIARSVEDNGGMYMVPAFAGLFAPYWRKDARGVIVGLTAFNKKAHFVRAALEAAAFQIWKVLGAMEKDSGVKLNLLKVDGGMTSNDLVMQFQADLIRDKVVRPKVTETTCLGAAFAAGLAVGFFTSLEQVADIWQPSKTWEPLMDEITVEKYIHGWEKAVQRSFGWETQKNEQY